MAREIERKFLVTSNTWAREVTSSYAIRQAYLVASDRASVRIRIDGRGRSTLTIKSAEPGLARQEFEYPLPAEDGEQMLSLRTGRVIEKRRHLVPHHGLVFEVDVFEGALEGLVIAEVELPDESHELRPPAWLGREVTHDRRYYNADLANSKAPPPSV